MIKYQVLCGDALHCESVFMMCCDRCGQELDDAGLYFMADHPSGRTESGNVGEVRVVCQGCQPGKMVNGYAVPATWEGHWMWGKAVDVIKFMKKLKKHKWPKEVGA